MTQLTRAVITAAGQDDRQLPLQRLVDRAPKTKTAIQIVVEEAAAQGSLAAWRPCGPRDHGWTEAEIAAVNSGDGMWIPRA